jgi:hypothetical protein
MERRHQDIDEKQKPRGRWQRPDNLIREHSGKRLSKGKQKAAKRLLKMAANGLCRLPDRLKKYQETVC